MKNDIQSRSEKFEYFLIMSIFVIGTIILLFYKIPIKNIVRDYQYNVLIILIAMELFTNLISSTGIIEIISLKIAVLSKGNKSSVLILFGFLMFIISAFLNNITAVLVILPIIFVLLKIIGINQRYVNIFFATILALSNTGGASSPIGDFPAIVIMNSGITTFLDYLSKGFPFFLINSVAIILWWKFHIKKDKQINNKSRFTISLLQSKYKNIKIKKNVLVGLGIILFIMFVCWSFIDQNVISPEIIAILGCALAMFYCIVNKVQVKTDIDLKPVLTIASFLYLSCVVSQTGILSSFAILLQENIKEPKLLLISIMIFTSLISGLFGAGPAASAMMPVIIFLCNGVFINQTSWVAIAYAASICAGSSLFMWSATAGFILSKKIDEAHLTDINNTRLVWNIKNYLFYGIQNYTIQLLVSVILIWIVVP